MCVNSLRLDENHRLGLVDHRWEEGREGENKVQKGRAKGDRKIESTEKIKGM